MRVMRMPADVTGPDLLRLGRCCIASQSLGLPLGNVRLPAIPPAALT